MTLTSTDSLDYELRTAAKLAREAGAAVLAWYGSTSADTKANGDPVTEADHAANRVILNGLSTAFPDDAVLSEEAKDEPDRLASRRIWIVDPLDGTKEFLARNGEFSIMIGLAIDGSATLGVVYRPVGDILYSARAHGGAFAEQGSERRTLGVADGRFPPRIVASRSHPDPLLTRMHQALGATDIMPSGSVGIKCALIAEGERDLYLHPVPYLKEWDTCAPEVILKEAGGEVSDCLGASLVYNKPDPRQPRGIVASGGGIHQQVLSRIGGIAATAGLAPD